MLPAFALLAAVGLARPQDGGLRLAGLFSDHMVLQRETSVPLWGRAAPGERVHVVAAWGDEDAAVAGPDGTWRVELDTPGAGGPHSIRVRGESSELSLQDVLVGEVWLCSGQSNMAMPVGSTGPGYSGVRDHEREIAAADHPRLRLFRVGPAYSPSPLDDVEGRWLPCEPDSVREFGASAYFFGRELLRELDVPVGLVLAAIGGTVAEAWTSEQGLAPRGDFEDELAELALLKRDAGGLDEVRRARIEAWWRILDLVDPGAAGLGRGAGWAAPELPDVAEPASGWRWADLPGPWTDGVLHDFNGVVWYRREVELPASWEGFDLELCLGPIDDMDTTWFNGEVVGEHRVDSAWSVPRRYVVPDRLTRPGANVIAVRVVDIGGAGGFTGARGDLVLRRADAPEDALSLAGPWRMRAGPGQRDLTRFPRSAALQHNHPTALWNGMIAPLAPFALRGFAWYQGESNRPRAHQYRTLFPDLIRDWRRAWGDELPFLFVQIAPFTFPEDRGETAELREAQRLALELPRTGMVVTMDVGDPGDIHPRDKQAVGRRLALWALRDVYGRDVVASGPLFADATLQGSRARVRFTEIGGGLVARGGPPSSFEVADLDGRWHAARAEIEGEEIVLSAPRVREVSAVRYAWDDDVEPNLFNAEGLPASPFTTSTDPWVTEGRQR